MPEPIVVAARLRPLLPREEGQETIVEIKDKIVTLTVGGNLGVKAYKLDHAFDSADPTSPSYASQDVVYASFGRKLLDSVLQGFNATIFAYGQTGTGKTTTIMGNMDPPSEQGILLRLVRDLFTEIDQLRGEGYRVECRVRMLEIYNEKIQDLLLPKDQEPKKLNVRVHPKLGPQVPNLIVEAVNSFHECAELIHYGNTMKTIGATAMNAKSSRSHTLFMLQFEKIWTQAGEDLDITTSEIYFVDLAGRENEKTTLVRGDRLIELGFINKSLFHLSNCIHMLGNNEDAERRNRQNDEAPSSPGLTTRSFGRTKSEGSCIRGRAQEQGEDASASRSVGSKEKRQAQIMVVDRDDDEEVDVDSMRFGLEHSEYRLGAPGCSSIGTPPRSLSPIVRTGPSRKLGRSKTETFTRSRKSDETDKTVVDADADQEVIPLASPRGEGRPLVMMGGGSVSLSTTSARKRGFGRSHTFSGVDSVDDIPSTPPLPGRPSLTGRSLRGLATINKVGVVSSFRNSKLTLLLYQGLTGNSRTSMIGTLSPAVESLDENLSTLNFAATVKKIRLEASAVSVKKKDLVESLQAEIADLKAQLERRTRCKSVEEIAEDEEVLDMQDRITATQEKYAQYHKSWEQAQSEARGNMSRRRSALMSIGISSFNTRKTFRPEPPCLINLSDDPSLRGTLIYHVPEGAEYSLGSGAENDIVLSGLSIAPRNCYIRNQMGKLSIYLAEQTLDEGLPRVEVNGVALKGFEPLSLKHHDRIVFGRSRAFYAVTEAEKPSADGRKGSLQPLFSFPQAEIERLEEQKLSETQIKELLDVRAFDPEQMEIAHENIRALKHHNQDDAGENAMRMFFSNARRAKSLVDEANEITNCLKPDQGLFFEIAATTPILATGYPPFALPVISVRLVRRLSGQRAKSPSGSRDRVRSPSGSPIHKRTSSKLGHLAQAVGSPVGGKELDEQEVSLWSFQRFGGRLEQMRDLYETWSSDKNNFTIDAALDPWKETGPTETADLLEKGKEEKVRSQELAKALHDSQQSKGQNTESRQVVILREELEAEVSNLKSEVEKLKNLLEKTKHENMLLQRELEESHHDRNSLREDLRNSVQEIRRLKNDLKAKDFEIQELKHQTENHTQTSSPTIYLGNFVKGGAQDSGQNAGEKNKLTQAWENQCRAKDQEMEKLQTQLHMAHFAKEQEMEKLQTQLHVAHFRVAELEAHVEQATAVPSDRDSKDAQVTCYLDGFGYVDSLQNPKLMSLLSDDVLQLQQVVEEQNNRLKEQATIIQMFIEYLNSTGNCCPWRESDLMGKSPFFQLRTRDPQEHHHSGPRMISLSGTGPAVAGSAQVRHGGHQSPSPRNHPPSLKQNIDTPNFPIQHQSPLPGPQIMHTPVHPGHTWVTSSMQRSCGPRASSPPPSSLQTLVHPVQPAPSNVQLMPVWQTAGMDNRVAHTRQHSGTGALQHSGTYEMPISDDKGLRPQASYVPAVAVTPTFPVMRQTNPPPFSAPF